VDPHERVLVVGGGIFGMSAAVALAQRGHARVEVLERDHLGSGSTAYAAGILSTQTWNDHDARLIHRTRGLLEELVAWGRREDLPAAATAWHPVGGITVAAPRHAARLDEMAARNRRLGIAADVLDAREAAKRFPGFRFGPDETVLTGPSDGYLESTDVVELLRRRGRALGVRIREGVAVESVKHEGGHVRGVALRGGASERADRVVVAGGAWTRGLLARSGLTFHAIPYRTQIATIDLEGAGDQPVLHDTALGFYARPESANRMLAGDGTQLRSFDPESFNRAADAEFVEATAGRVVERFAHGAAARYRTGWAGLCVGTPDRHPLAGPFPGVAGLHLLTGDNGFGVMRGLALGELVAAAVDGERREDAEALRIDRFGPTDPDRFVLAEGFSFGD
jgi:glycine/D-amino acid oxidase-like deaminating enzyme